MSKAGKGKLTRIVARLETSMVAQGSALETVAELSHKKFLSNKRDLRKVSGAVQNVQTMIGQPIELDTNFDTPTLWSATSFVADEVVQVAEGLRLMEGMISPMRDAALKVKTEVGKLAKASNPTKMMSFFKVVSSKMKEASQEIVALKERVNSIET
jgi:hypothetical protein